MATDKFGSFAVAPATPATRIQEITPNDSADLEWVTAAINVATPGTVRVTTVEGDVADLMIGAGIAFPLRITRVWKTGTTATGIRGLV